MGRHTDSSDEEIPRAGDGSEEGDSSEEEKDKKSKKSSKQSSSSSHKKKKSKDKKKHKKRSKKHRRRSSSSEDDSGGSADEWVEKSQSKPEAVKKPDAEDEDITNEGVFKKPKVESPVVASTSKISREEDDNEWMSFGDALPTFSNDSKRSQRKKQKELEREASSIDKLGKHVNELNPYWKDGGTGLPEELPEKEAKKETTASPMIGDGGLNYLRKAFIRAKEQAAEEGRSLEDVVSERWGSLEKFLGMLEEAENKAKERTKGRERDDSRDRDRSKRFMRPRRDSDDEGDNRNSSSRYSSRRQDRHHDRDRDRHRRRSKDRDSGWRKRKESPERRSKEKGSPERDIKRAARSPSPSSSRVQNLPLKPASTTYEIKPRQVDRPRSPSPDDEQMEVEQEAPKVLSDKEMNELNAKLMKAEMLGNTSAVDDLKIKIAEAEKVRQDFIKNGGDPSKPQNASTKVVTKVIMDDSRGRGRRKDKVTETHKDGQRVRYFPDDDRQTLKNMFQKEKMNTAADENALFARLAGKNAKTGLDYDIDDVFTDKASSSKQSSKEQEREIKEVLDEEKHYKKVLDNCQWCFDGSAIEKHLILSVAEKCYLCVPPYQSLSEGHCLIVPMAHVSCATELDEDVWAEMQKFRKALVRMFKEADEDMVIFETALALKRHPHMYLECVPMPKETGELAPIYFKKAIQECETEWSQNKKLVELRNRDVRRAIPKGLPYFSVDFGDDSCGFAHVVEDERNFPRNFAHEIVGGMMELDHHLWRKQKKDDFRTQRNKVMEFLKTWGPHDWTREAN